MFGLSGMELTIILIFGFLIFGPDKLPDIAATAVKFINQFRKAQEQMNKMIQEEIVDPIKDNIEPIMNPFAGILDSDGAAAKEAKEPKGEDEGEPVAEEERPNPEQIKAALVEAQEERRKAVAQPPAEGDGPAPKESFAARRARLEQELASQREQSSPHAASGGD